MDYYLISKNTAEIVSEVYIDRTSNLSDHRPIRLHISPSALKRGRGFWHFNNTLLKDANFVESCNRTIADTMKMHSPDLQRYKNPDSETCATAEFEIGHTLLQDVIMMEPRA